MDKADRMGQTYTVASQKKPTICNSGRMSQHKREETGTKHTAFSCIHLKQKTSCCPSTSLGSCSPLIKTLCKIQRFKCTCLQRLSQPCKHPKQWRLGFWPREAEKQSLTTQGCRFIIKAFVLNVESQMFVF